ncbi:hypothetical protein K7432_015932 [Basidiobolus ranarum]|uniref:Uncharacterized protein n=1 Tax=Basidiobolus ranarum TaxID=34480 RepID=A0ABR2WFH9_9FUNG
MPLAFVVNVFAQPNPFMHSLWRHIHWFPRRQFYFATEENRNKYDNFVLNIFRHPYRVRKAAEHLYNNLELQLAARGVHPVSKIHTAAESNRNISLGSFLGVHGRRGDFVEYDWIGNLSSIVIWQESIAYTMEYLKYEKELKVFYLASDETSLDAYEMLYRYNMIRIFDLMDSEFVSEYTYLGVFGDWLALLDQHILARSEFFIATYMSSLSGGVLNMRKGLGVKNDPTTREWMESLL